VAQDLTITSEKCINPGSIQLSEILEGGNVVVSLSERALGRVTATDVKNPVTGEVVIKKSTMIDESGCDKIDAAGVKFLNVYSVMTCSSKEGVCATCYGRDLSRGKMVHVGEAIGMISAQSIGEPGTQLTMRTFHVGGTASVKQESQIVTKTEGVLKIINSNLLEDSKKNLIVMGRNTQLSIQDNNGVQIAIYKVAYGSKLFFQNDDKVKANTIICEWDPYTTPVIAEKSGIAGYVDLIDGVSIQETTDDATGISSKSVIDWRAQSKNTDLKPRITLRDEKGNVIKKADDNEARYYLVPDSILSVKDGQKISAGDVIARLPKETTKTKDITGGLPRVAELFEARKAKDSAIIAENDGQVIFGKEVRGKQRVSIVPEDGTGEPSNYLIPKGKHINFNQGEKIKKGEYLLDGQPLPHDILRILGIKELTEYFVNQVQEVYRLQGVVINDKHIETILRQMLKKVEVKVSGDSKILPGEIVDRIKFETMNEKLESEGKKPAIGERVLMGITKASLQTESFISAASFQETTRVLTDAAIRGKVDKLTGLKENVIVGRLVPAGTGSVKKLWNRKAYEDDKKFLSEQEAIESSKSQVNQ
jgi:DNA-directed RNA polymerase subunit beta'